MASGKELSLAALEKGLDPSQLRCSLSSATHLPARDCPVQGSLETV